MSSDRQACGTYRGMRLHIDLGEPLCPECAQLALAKSLTHERHRVLPNPEREPAHIRDLRAIIAALAELMSSKAQP